MAMRARLLLLSLLSLSVVGCDHATKELAAEQFRNGPLPLLSGALILTYTENRDMAFGLLGPFLGAESRLWLLGAAKSLAVVAGAVFLLLQHARASWKVLLAVSLITAGAGGNLIDRVTRGYVIDFLRGPHWPVFNVADMAICTGAALLYPGMAARRTPSSAR